MGNLAAEIFGYVVLGAAAVLLVWEYLVHQGRGGGDAWLVTPGRLRRRMIMAAMLAVTGVMIVLEAREVIVLEQPKHLIFYVTALLTLAAGLMVLSVRDLSEMARSAEKHAMDDLKSAIVKTRQAPDSAGEGQP